MKANRAAQLRKSWDDDEAAVSDIIGSIILVGITVVMAAGLGFLLLSLDGPQDTQYTDLAYILDPGADGKWQGQPGDGDSEQLRIIHIGGEPLRASRVTASVVVGNLSSILSGTTMALPLGTGTDLTLGEVWVSNQSLAADAVVTLTLVTQLPNGGGQMLASSVAVTRLQPSPILCGTDTAAPTATVPLGQNPADLTSASSGNVTVTATLTDSCSGVDASLPPQLWYCIAVSCSFPSTYINAGSMALNSSLWTGVIPHGSWAGDIGKTLNFRLVNMTDVAGNQGNSPIQADLVTVFTVYSYPTAFLVTTGTLGNGDNSKSATDDGLEATLSEGPVGGAAGTVALVAQSTGITTSGNGWLSEADAAGSDDVFATNANDGRTITIPLTDPVGSPGIITQVIVRAEVSILNANGDRWHLFACISGICNTASSHVGAATDTTIAYDVTTARPGGGGWSWADITNLQVRLGTVKSGNVDGTWRIDNASADVSYLPNYNLDVQANFTGVPAGTQNVEIRHRNATGETFRVEACTAFSATCTAWTALGSLPSAGTPTTTVFALPGGAYLSGAPRLRFLDATTSTTQGSLYVDFVRVATT